MTSLERELRAALAAPPGADELGEPQLAGLERRIARARRRRVAAGGLSVVAVLAFGAVGVSTLTRSAQDKSTLNATSADGIGGPAIVHGGALAPAPAGSQPVPAEVLAAARRALTRLGNGKPAGTLRWVATGPDYLVQVPLTTTTTCKICQDPGGIPASGAVIELRVPIAPASGSAAGGQPPAVTAPPVDGSRAGTTFPGFRLLSTYAAADLNAYAGVKVAPFLG